ncbi:hypothetical protein [Niabella hibiscisoli]|uniref:hypothetical protein n=1 Tax=Niabella hibiscisoli TaxID=1825928 RepID=UPI001F0E241E|nr:hypothetical protein [Niabella hibiscisoli]MCH5718262.1 hypothetical protein [Niabella hibiscisoli]
MASAAIVFPNTQEAIEYSSFIPEATKVVFKAVENKNGLLYLDKIVTTSEHSIVQIVFFNASEIDNVIKEIERLKMWMGRNG